MQTYHCRVGMIMKDTWAEVVTPEDVGDQDKSGLMAKQSSTFSDATGLDNKALEDGSHKAGKISLS